MKSTYIYRGWKRDMLILMLPIIGLWFDTEESQMLVPSCYHGLKKMTAKSGRVGYRARFKRAEGSAVLLVLRWREAWGVLGIAGNTFELAKVMVERGKR
jgi:hypothetical protein